MAIIDEVASDGNTILFIDEIFSESAPGMPDSSVLKPAPTRDDFR